METIKEMQDLHAKVSQYFERWNDVNYEMTPEEKDLFIEVSNMISSIDHRRRNRRVRYRNHIIKRMGNNNDGFIYEVYSSAGQWFGNASTLEGAESIVDTLIETTL